MTLKGKHIILVSIVVIGAIHIAFRARIKDSKEVVATLVTKNYVYEAGNEIALSFKLNTVAHTTLVLHATFGTTTLVSMSQEPQFVIPDFISRKKGKIAFTLLSKSKVLYKGELDVMTNTETNIELESYIGPPSIIAGGIDYTMPVIIATDSYDNPLPDSTKVYIKHQFLNIEREDLVYSKDMIGWRNIFSYRQSGRILLFSKVEEVVSKEFSVEVYPSLPENFEITSNRKHTYADGNQITDFITSIIKDEYGNIISDGSLVEFVIKDLNGSILHAQGSTINGRAVAKILHPDHEDVWRVKAYVHGMAESNEITVKYAPIIDDFEVKFDMGNRKIMIGPLMSFMEQLIPDGALVKVVILKNGEEIDTQIKTSYDGMITFWLQNGFYKSGNYDVYITALGIEKQYKNIRLQ